MSTAVEKLRIESLAGCLHNQGMRLGLLVAGLGFVAAAHAIEGDTFPRAGEASLRDSGMILDAVVDSWITNAVREANRNRTLYAASKCDPRPLEDSLRRHVGASKRLGPAMHDSALKGFAEKSPLVAKRGRALEDTIYGLDPKAPLSLWAHALRRAGVPPLVGGRYPVLVADAIVLHGRAISLDKFNHFFREGLQYRDIKRVHGGDTREAVEQGKRWEGGAHGLQVSGVFSWADLSANFSGMQFWEDLLDRRDPRDARAFVTCEASTGLYRRIPGRRFSFVERVNAAWDETLNCSEFAPEVRKTVDEHFSRIGASCPVRADACETLNAIPRSTYFVNPACRVKPLGDKKSEFHVGGNT